MVQQHRRQDLVRDGQVVKSEKPFTSPSSGTSTEVLIGHKELFNSNGFVHYREGAISWNPK